MVAESSDNIHLIIGPFSYAYVLWPNCHSYVYVLHTHQVRLKASAVYYPLNTGNLFLSTFILQAFSDDLPKHECEECHDNMLPLLACHFHRPRGHDARSGKCVNLLHCWCHGMCNHLHSVVLFFISAFRSAQLLEFHSPCEWLMCQGGGSNSYFSYALWCNNASSHFFLATRKGTFYFFKVHP